MIGTHDIAVTKPNYVPATRRVIVPTGADTPVDFVLQSDLASLTITSVPPGAAIAIDGKDQMAGRTPIQVAVSSGTHQVVATLAGSVDGSQQITVAAGESKKLSFTLSSLCDINGDGKVDATDVELMRTAVLSGTPVTAKIPDLDGDGRYTVVDVQRVINATLGKGCRTDPTPPTNVKATAK